VWRQLGRPRPACDHEDVSFDGRRVRPLEHLDAELERASHELARHPGRVGEAVLAADGRAQDVVRVQPLDVGRVDALDRYAELGLELPPLVEAGEPSGVVARKR
jgi:hypothetical protein